MAINSGHILFRPQKWPEPARRAAAAFGLAAAYYVAGRLALLLAIPPGYATAVWPSAGIALAGILLFGNRVWPAIWLGSFLINIGTSLDTNSTAAILKSFALTASLGAGATLQGLTGAALMRRWVGFPSSLTQQSEALKFLAVATSSCLVSPTLGVSTLWLGNVIQGTNYLFSWGTWWVGDTIGVLIFTPLILIWTIRSPATWPRRQLSVCLPLIFTFAIVVALFIYASAWEQNRLRADFERRTDEVAQRFKKSFEGSIGVLHSIAALHSAVPSLDRNQFHDFLKSYLRRHSSLQALTWCVRVPNDQRAACEATVRREGFSDFQFVEQTATGLGNAAVRDEYFPILFIEPYEGNQRALGLDIASDPLRRWLLQQATDSAGPIASSVISQDSAREPALLVVLPVYRNGLPHKSVAERRQNLLAFTSAVFRLRRLMAVSQGELNPNGVQIRLFDQPAQGPGRLLYGPPLAPASLSKSTPLEITRAIEVAGGRWTLQLAVPQQYLISHRSWAAWTMLIGGLLFTAVLGALLMLVTGRAALVEELVARRTAELHLANQDLQHQISERQRAKEQIKASLEEKEVMLREIHHRVRNNLQVISSMLYLQGRAIQHPDAQRWLQESQHRVKAMALVHQQLDHASNLSRIDLADYLRNLMTELSRSFPSQGAPISWRVESAEVFVSTDAALGCGLIVNELASNSFKHAFPDGRPGQILIQLQAQADRSIYLRFHDDGIGIPKDLQIDNGQSIGLQFVRMLTQQLSGQLECRNGSGTQFTLTFTEKKSH